MRETSFQYSDEYEDLEDELNTPSSGSDDEEEAQLNGPSLIRENNRLSVLDTLDSDKQNVDKEYSFNEHSFKGISGSSPKSLSKPAALLGPKKIHSDKSKLDQLHRSWTLELVGKYMKQARKEKEAFEADLAAEIDSIRDEIQRYRIDVDRKQQERQLRILQISIREEKRLQEEELEVKRKQEELRRAQEEQERLLRERAAKEEAEREHQLQLEKDAQLRREKVLILDIALEHTTSEKARAEFIAHRNAALNGNALGPSQATSREPYPVDTSRGSGLLSETEVSNSKPNKSLTFKLDTTKPSQQIELSAKSEPKPEAKPEAKPEPKLVAKPDTKADPPFTDFEQVARDKAHNISRIEDIKKTIVEPVAADAQLKKLCFGFKRQIKPKMGQLTNSMSQLKRILDEVFTVIQQARVANNQLVYQWVLNFVAKSIVHQAETESTVSIQSSVPLGMLAVQLMAREPLLTELLIARFVKKCPQIIGYSCPIDTVEGRKRMGWKMRNEKWEDETAYCERISGMVSVWTVITQAKFNATSGRTHPYKFDNSWKFIARQLNKPAEQATNADYSAVAAWWDIAAPTMADAYGVQGKKILNLLWDDWTQANSDKNYPAARRLRLLGEEWQKTGKLDKAWEKMDP